MSAFRTRHQGCASLLRYALGDAAHVRTYTEPDRRVSFEFDDLDGRCTEMAQLFFSAAGAAISSARELLDCHRAVRRTVTDAIGNGGEWRNQG